MTSSVFDLPNTASVDRETSDLTPSESRDSALRAEKGSLSASFAILIVCFHSNDRILIIAHPRAMANAGMLAKLIRSSALVIG